MNKQRQKISENYILMYNEVYRQQRISLHRIKSMQLKWTLSPTKIRVETIVFDTLLPKYYNYLNLF